MASDTVSSRLAEDVALMRAERDIMETLNRYSWSIDYGREDEWVDCFLEDGIYQVKGYRTSTPRRVEGRDALRAYFQARSPRSQQKHVATTPMIRVQGDRATVESFFIGFNADDGRPQLFLIGRYTDQMVRCPDGAWRFQERVFEGENDPPSATS